jgi:hypothetical protein
MDDIQRILELAGLSETVTSSIATNATIENRLDAMQISPDEKTAILDALEAVLSNKGLTSNAWGNMVLKLHPTVKIKNVLEMTISAFRDLIYKSKNDNLWKSKQGGSVTKDATMQGFKDIASKKYPQSVPPYKA